MRSKPGIKTVILGILSLLIGLSVAVSPSLGSPSGNDQTPITIGVAAGFTGFMSSFDGPPYEAARLAVRDINARGGVMGRPLALAKFDMKTQPPLGRTGALELIDNGAVAVLCSADFDIGASCAVAAQSRKVVGMSLAAGDPKFGAQGIGQFAYTMGDLTNQTGAVLAEFAASRGWKNAYILTDTSWQYTKTLTNYFDERFTQLGGRVQKDTMVHTDSTIATQVTRLRSANPRPDVILINAFVPSLPSRIKQVQNAGLNIPILGHIGYDGTYWIKSIPRLSNVYFPTYGFIGNKSGGAAWKLANRYRQSAGSRPLTSQFLTGYAAIQVLADAIRRAKSTEPEAINNQLERTKGLETVLGLVTITPNVHARVRTREAILRFQNGKIQFVRFWTPRKVPNPFG